MHTNKKADALFLENFFLNIISLPKIIVCIIINKGYKVKLYHKIDEKHKVIQTNRRIQSL